MAEKIESCEKTACEEDVTLKSGITAEFLELQLGYKIDSFSVGRGSKPGDNYMSDLYSIEVKDSLSGENRHYLIKCCPDHPSRQKFINTANHFCHELAFYSKLAPDLNRMLQQANERLALAPYHGGHAVNYTDTGEGGEDVKSEGENWRKACSSLDNFILMTDLRKELGFQMPDCSKGLDGDHVKLAFLELASLHAGSWAYRQKILKGGDLVTKYPFLTRIRSQKKANMWLGLLKENTMQAVTVLDAVKGKDNVLSKALLHFLEKGPTLLGHFSKQDATTEQELAHLLRISDNGEMTGGSAAGVPWRVVCHGDCWTNNLLFRYDQISGSPKVVVLIDFPLAKVACPTLDLACLVYTSTRRDFRHAHLNNCLTIYVHKFIEICNQLNVDPLPNLRLESLQSRFHKAKLLGLLIALISLPLNLIGDSEAAEISVGQAANHTLTMDRILQETCSAAVTGSTLYQEWIVELVEDLYDEGVI